MSKKEEFENVTSDNSSLIHPTLHHFGIETRHLKRMIDWYAKVVGMVMIYSILNTRGSEDGMSFALSLMTKPITAWR